MIEFADEEDPTTQETEVDEDSGLLEAPPSRSKMGRPRKYPEGTPKSEYESQKKHRVGRVNTETILRDIERIKEANPGKPQREIHRLFMESKRDWILAKLFDTAENGDTPTIRFNAQARLKDELDGRVATQDKRDPDEDNAIGKILIPEEM